MAGRRARAIFTISRCARDAFHEYSVTRSQLCETCFNNARLICANRWVQHHRAVLSTAGKTYACTICSASLTTFSPAVDCDVCIDAITNFLRNLTPAKATLIYESHLFDTVSIRIDRVHVYL